MAKVFGVIFSVIALFLLTLLASLGIIALMIKILSCAVGFTFTWKIVIAVWVVLFLLNGIKVNLKR